MNPKPTLLIHGGAGTINRQQLSAVQEQAFVTAMEQVLQQGQGLLMQGGSALDAVTLAVSLLEDCELFNAGKGSVYTSAGTHEMDAAVMRGSDLAAGAVVCVSQIRNPVQAARAVLQHSPHVMLAGAGAEAFAQQQGLAFATPAYFASDFRYAQLLAARSQAQILLDHSVSHAASASGQPLHPDQKFGTVGAVALDQYGELAAATSTGGMTNKLPGRVGDSPIPGAGCYADNRTAALSATGTGEAFIRVLALHDVASRIRYAGASLREAAEQVIFKELPSVGGSGGLIGLNRAGEMVMCFNTEGMYRGYVTGHNAPVCSIYG